jgi:hypothetical protein
VPSPESPLRSAALDSKILIRLPLGRPGARFDAGKLVEHLNAVGRHYIIQGQTNCALAVHPKPQSLDVWLRKNFAHEPNMKQAVNEVLEQLISSGLFEEGKFLCPDSGHQCKGIRLVAAVRG